MSEPENFLSRWSRRKLEVEQDSAEPQHPDETASVPQARPHDEPPEEKPDRPDQPDKSDEPVFDIASLPSIESITAETDIRMFFHKGVPAELTRAALRRAWIADPAIRDFKEIAENQWDFATGSDLPGFGSLDASADDIRKMVADIFGDGPKDGHTPPAEAGSPTEVQPEPVEAKAQLEEPAPQASTEIADANVDQPLSEAVTVDVVRRGEVDIAMQQRIADDDYEPAPVPRSHGRALPR
jgi:hypothetical protein